ncbi:MAG: P-loop NTPase [Deltaproteobacteria bacterium]|nr:P-loop NTPase [Deltaproteobacteria bacterium]
MGLKLAISGKGGVGKTTVAALIARILSARGSKVIAIDADPVPNLGAALGIPEDRLPEPISELSEMIHERTGSKPGTMGGFFKLNPKVDDLPESLSEEIDGIKLLTMGTVDHGGSGCVCPESVLLKALVQHLVLQRDEVIIMDMEAGVEHLGRATSTAVDLLAVVVNPGKRSVQAAKRILPLARDLKIKRIGVILNRSRGQQDAVEVRELLPEFEFLGALTEHDEILDSDRLGKRPFDDISKIPQEISSLIEHII